jgi:PAS domain S-box-containing protein
VEAIGVARVIRRVAASNDLMESDRGLIVLTRDGTIVHASDAFGRLVGLSAAEIVGTSVTALDPVSTLRSEWILARLPESGKGYRYASEFATPNGPRPVNVEVYGVSVDGRNLIVATVSDAAVASASAASDAGTLDEVFQAAPVGVVIYGPGLRILRVNRLVERMGRITGNHIGMRLQEAVPDANPIMVGAIREVFLTGEAVVNMEASGVDDRTYLMNLFPIGERGGVVERVGCIFLDVTLRLSAERALVDSERYRREILATLLQAEEDVRSRIATELHDDTVQVMTATLLAMDRVSIAARKAADPKIESAVMLARATLEEATDRTRRLMFELRPEILHEHGLQAALRLVAAHTAREANAHATVTCDVGRFDHTVEELVYRTVREALVNVRRHANPEEITVTVTEQSGAVIGEIRDDGQGFDAARVRSRPDAVFHLGLDSLVERIRSAGGDASVVSVPGEGTRVRFSIPVPASATPV